MASCLIIITWRVNWIWLFGPGGRSNDLPANFAFRLRFHAEKKAQKSAQKHGQNGWQINRELVNNPIPIPKHRPGPRRQRFWTTSECECYKARMLLACCCCCCYAVAAAAVAVAAAALLLPLVWTAPCNYLTTTECGNYVSRYILAKRVAGVAAKRGPIIKHITIITITLRSQREGARDRESA